MFSGIEFSYILHGDYLFYFATKDGHLLLLFEKMSICEKKIQK